MDLPPLTSAVKRRGAAALLVMTKHLSSLHHLFINPVEVVSDENQSGSCRSPLLLFLYAELYVGEVCVSALNDAQIKLNPQHNIWYFSISLMCFII